MLEACGDSVPSPTKKGEKPLCVCGRELSAGEAAGVDRLWGIVSVPGRYVPGVPSATLAALLCPTLVSNSL